jgi:predicted transposase/invertase (TIGR01784 family)
MSSFHEKIETGIQKLRPVDDAFFEVLADDVAFCQEILRIILEDENLIVHSVTPQKDVKNLVGRSVRLDVLCTLSDGTKCNVEVQRSDNDNHMKRIRYNASCITASETKPGDKFENVPTVIVVYISEFDIFHDGKTIYHIENVVRETGKLVDNGLHIVCVNTKVDDGTDIAELMKCFTQEEVNNSKFPAFSNRMNFLKHSEGGAKIMTGVMSDIMKEYAEEYAEEYARDKMVATIKTALDEGLKPEMVARIFGVTLDTVQQIQSEESRKTQVIV